MYKERDAKTRVKRIEAFIAKAIQKHGAQYDYSLVKQKYTNSRTHIELICKNCHTRFTTLPQDHIANHPHRKGGCPVCVRPEKSLPKAIRTRWSNSLKERIDAYVSTANEKHDHGYEYPKIFQEYRNEESMITIVCKACGDVTQKKARIHTFKTRFGGCKHCNKESMRQRISEKNRARQSYNYENKDTKQPIGSIYKITNQKNRNIYIGYTFSTLQERFKQHWDHSKRKKRNGTPVSSTYLHKAMRKYGKETFQIESMQTYSNISPIQIAEKEKEAIALHKPQYNLTKGGDIFGVALSKRQRAYAKERLIETVGKAVAMIDVKGRVIKKFKTLSEAARTLNCNSSGISKACRNAKPYRGYFWSYLNEEV